ATVPVKMEMEDCLQEQQHHHSRLHKRPRSVGMDDGSTVSPSEYNPLDEPSPLGLRLRKSPSLLELIQMKLSQGTTATAGNQNHHVAKEAKAVAAAAAASSGDKLKASNFPGSLLRIGNWEYKSRYEGDLVAKCYFAKHKLVWEVLDGGLKNKIEIQWSDIVSLKGHHPEDAPGTLHVVLARQPLFFRETNPQPRKHTLWQATSDFTGGEATIHRRHYLECPQGLMGKHFEKLVQCDPRLRFLSQQEEPKLDSPYFEPRIQQIFDDRSIIDEFDLNRDCSPPTPSFFSLHEGASSTTTTTTTTTKTDVETMAHETPSTSSDSHMVAAAVAADDVPKGGGGTRGGWEQLKDVGNWDRIMVPGGSGLHSSMSMSDLVNHLESRMSEQESPTNPNLSLEDWEGLQMLDDINRCLFGDFHGSNGVVIAPDDKSLMSRVNSLCCLLQKDPNNPGSDSSTPQPQPQPKRDDDDDSNKKDDQQQQACSSISRKDSIGDLLMNLPRIASLPQFLFNISQDFETTA
ncbi:hypothetical protein M569_05482, partial [Genlisea aurea]